MIKFEVHCDFWLPKIIVQLQIGLEIALFS